MLLHLLDIFHDYSSTKDYAQEPGKSGFEAIIEILPAIDSEIFEKFITALCAKYSASEAVKRAA